MNTAIIPYDPYHPHLLYTFGCTIVGWIVTMGYGRWKLHRAPVQRIYLYSVALMLPLYAEGAALLAYTLRPAPDTTIGSMLSHFHAFTMQQYPIDSFLSVSSRVMIGLGLGSLMLFSLLYLLNSRAAIAMLFQAATPLATTHPELAQTIATYATKYQYRQPVMLVVDHQAPLAFATGVLHPRIYITTRLLHVLEPNEVLAVMCHEWAHILRRDLLWNWCLLIIRNTLAFLVVPLVLWRKIQASQDEACDRQAAQMTQQPLVLAQALVKVAKAWKTTTPAPSLIAANAFVKHDQHLNQRVQQMLDYHRSSSLQQKRHYMVYAIIVMLLILAPLPALLGS